MRRVSRRSVLEEGRTTAGWVISRFSFLNIGLHFATMAALCELAVVAAATGVTCGLGCKLAEDLASSGFTEEYVCAENERDIRHFPAK